MIAIVCGGNDYRDPARLAKVLDRAVTELRLDTIIQGHGGKERDGKAVEGADLLARDWALARGDISVIDVPADWDGWRERGQVNAAGPVRNKLMLDILCGGSTAVERAVIAFPGGNGTANMVNLATSPQAKKRDVKLYEIDKVAADA